MEAGGEGGERRGAAAILGERARSSGDTHLRVGDLLLAAAAGPSGRGTLVVLLVVRGVVLPSSAGLDASSVWRLRMAARSAEARATTGLRAARHFTAFGTAGSWARLRPGDRAPGGWRRRAPSLRRGGGDHAARRRWRGRPGGRRGDSGRRGRDRAWPRGGPRSRGSGGRRRARGRRSGAYPRSRAGSRRNHGLG